MIFSSFFYLLVFLPLCWLGTQLLRKNGRGALPIAWLLGCSCLFFAWQYPPHLLLLIASIGFNYTWGELIRRAQRKKFNPRIRWLILAVGVSANLGAIAWFKYGLLAVETANSLVQAGFVWEVLLPLGISFFTFQQIAYLVDVHRYQLPRTSLLEYALFVSFFPQLIAGPIVHHGDILPQLRRRFGHHKLVLESTGFAGRQALDVSVGLSIFAMGLFKKVVFADQFAIFADPVFASADAARPVSFFAAWVGALAWSLQLYFDFSGYSDMAVGAARLFGVRLPMNFFSPYKATNVIEFWRRWHLTLSHFLRDYLYIPLGGGRVGRFRRYFNLMATMLLGGLWHGASWTFVAWGALHGIFLCVNHLSNWIGQRELNRPSRSGGPLTNHLKKQNLVARVRTPICVSITFCCVVFAWVLFRAETFEGAGRLVVTMLGGEGLSFEADYFDRKAALLWVGIGLFVVWFLPNTNQIFRHYRPVILPANDTIRELMRLPRCHTNRLPLTRLVWRPTYGWAFAIAILSVVALVLLDRPSEFIYYRF